MRTVRRGRLPRFLPVIAAVALSACATFPQRTPYTLADLSAATPLPGGVVRYWASDDDEAYRRWGESVLRQRQGRGISAPATLLALSGGSDKGAFGAGLLNAWSRRGDRPVFDIITGVSTGALIAPFAFLGREEDATLMRIYTSISSKDIYRQRVLSGLFGGASVLDSKPLSRLIAHYVTPAFLERIAAQHRAGRRLLVMTTQLDAERGVIWDMGAIAATASPQRLALFRQVLLASSSIPGAFPPVLIDMTGQGRSFAEMHVDGGTVSGFFTLPRAMLLTEAAGTTAPPGSAIYVVYNGRLDARFDVTKPRTFSILSRALTTVLGEADRTNVADLRSFAQDHNIGFSVCAIQRATPRDDAPLFDTAHMRELYAMGEREGTSATGCLAKGGEMGVPSASTVAAGRDAPANSDPRK